MPPTAGSPPTGSSPSKENGGPKPLAPVYSRIKVFEHPFAYQVNNNKINDFCSHCLRAPKHGEKLHKCANCEYTLYCNKECQRLAWKVHRNECKRLKKVFPNLPLTEVLFLSKVIDRVVFIEENGDKFNWQYERKFSSLVDHKDEIRACPIKSTHFEKLVGKMTTFRGEEMIDKEKFFDIFCKVSINSHSIHTSAGTEIAMCIDLGVSMYNHSCRPTCTLVFDGYRAFLRPLLPDLDAADTSRSFISYIDVGRSRYVRRKDLKSRWFFDCECERCMDPNDGKLTRIRCSNKSCDEALPCAEDSEVTMLACPKCRTITDEDYVRKAQEFMKSLPDRFYPDSNPEMLEKLLVQAEEILHESNVYITRLNTAILHIRGTLKDNLPLIHKQVYENYKQCFPQADRHVGYQLLHIVKALIEKGRREEAVSYAYDAMNIFEVCFGLDHPYYLQTLALWTFLEQRKPKTDNELISLTNFSDNRPVDVLSIIHQNFGEDVDAPY